MYYVNIVLSADYPNWGDSTETETDMIVHLCAVAAAFSLAFPAILNKNWQTTPGLLCLLLLGGVLVDFLWHSVNHKFKPWAFETLMYTGWIAVLGPILVQNSEAIHWSSVFMIFWGQAMWDLNLHSRVHHENQELWTAEPWVQCVSTATIVTGLVLAA